MSLFNIFKKKKTIKKEAKPKVEKVKEDKSSSLRFANARVVEELAESKPQKIRKETKISQSFRILKIPHITEKATDLTQNNQYAFRVFPKTNKIELKKAIEDIYGVDVVSVRIINVPKKKKRLGRIQGIKPGYKKAIVKIKKGQKIELLPR